MPSVSNIATLGVVIPPVQGGQDVVTILKDIDKQATAAALSLDKLTAKSSAMGTAATAPVKQYASAQKDLQGALAATGGALGNLEGSFARNASGLGLLLRSIGPMGGAASVMAERIERGALAIDNMAARSKAALPQQDLLNKLWRDGAIALPTLASAHERLSLAQQNLTKAEGSYMQVLTYTTNLQQKSAVGANVQSQAAQLLTSRRQQLAAASQEASAAQNVMNAAESAGAGAMLSVGQVVIGVIAGVIALATAIKLVTSAWDLFTSSLSSGAQLELTRQRFENMIQNTAAANQLFEQLRDISTGSGGFFSTETLSRITGQLYTLGTGFEDLLPLAKGFTEIASQQSVPIEQIQSAYLGLIDTLKQVRETGSGIQTRQLTAWAREGIPIVDMLTQSMGKSETQIRNLFAAGQIGTKEIRDAFELFGQQSDSMERNAGTALGLIGQISEHWKDVKEAFGEPVVVALEPILREILPFEETAEDKARALGRAVADLINQIGNAARGGHLWDGITIGLEIAAMEAANSASRILIDGFKFIGKYIGEHFVEWIRGSLKWANLFAELATGNLTGLAGVVVSKVAEGQATAAPGAPWKPFSDDQLAALRAQMQGFFYDPLREAFLRAIPDSFDDPRTIQAFSDSIVGAVDDNKFGDALKSQFTDAMSKSVPPAFEGQVSLALGPAAAPAAVDRSVATAGDQVQVFNAQMKAYDESVEAGDAASKGLTKSLGGLGEQFVDVRMKTKDTDQAFRVDAAAIHELDNAILKIQGAPALETLRATMEKLHGTVGSLQDPIGHLGDLLKRAQAAGATPLDQALITLDAHLRDLAIQAESVTTHTGLMRTSLNGIIAEINKSQEPNAHLQAFIDALPEGADKDAQAIVRWAVAYRQLQLAASDAELRMKAGIATFGESFTAGLNKWVDAMGTADEQISKMAGHMADVLTNDISKGLNDIIDGTVGVAAGFRAMTVSILRDLSQLILKTAIEIEVTAALKALLGGVSGGVGGGGGDVYGQIIAEGVAYGASGGAVTGGSGTKDDVPIMAMGGEYMLRKSAVRNQGIENLDLLNRGAAHIVPNHRVRHMAGGGEVGSGGARYYDPELPYYGEAWHWAGGYGYYGPSPTTDTGAAGGVPYYAPGGWQGWDAEFPGGANFSSSAAGGGGGLQQMDTGQSSGIPGGGPDSGIEFPPADISQTGVDQFDTGQPFTAPFDAQALSSVFDYAANTAAEEAKYASQPGHAREAAIAGGFSSTGTQIIGSGFYSGPTSFSSASSGLYGGLEGGLTTGSVGGFSGAAGAFGGGGGGLKPTRQYLADGGYVYPIPSFATGGVMPWTGPAWLHQGETVTPAAAAPSNLTNNITVHVEGGSGGKSRTTGTDNQDARAIAEAIKVTVIDQIGKQRRFGGELYAPRSG